MQIGGNRNVFNTKSNMIVRSRKLLTIIMSITLLTLSLVSCTKKDYSATASDLLKTLSDGVLVRGGMDADVRVITVNLTNFKDFPVDEYIEWVTNEYSSDDCFVFASKK